MVTVTVTGEQGEQWGMEEAEGKEGTIATRATSKERTNIAVQSKRTKAHMVQPDQGTHKLQRQRTWSICASDLVP